MNGLFMPVVTLETVVETAMGYQIPFNRLCQWVHAWMTERGHRLIDCHRQVSDGVGIITIRCELAVTEKTSMRANGGGDQYVIVHIDEYADYTLAQPLSTW